MEQMAKQLEQILEVSCIANIQRLELADDKSNIAHGSAFYEMVYVDQGTLWVEGEHYTGELKAKQLLIHSVGEPHAFSRAHGQATVVVIVGFVCDLADLDQLATRPVELSTNLQSLLADVFLTGQTVFMPPYDVFSTAYMEKRTDIPYGAEQMLKLKMELLLLHLMQLLRAGATVIDNGNGQVKIGAVKDYLDRYYRENISLNQLCFLFNTNKTTLCQQFRRAYDCTVIEYIGQLKMQQAKMMLEEGRCNVSEIAWQLGFSSVHYFSRMFKHHTGVSPTAYRQTCKEPEM